MNVIELLEFELVYYDSTVQRFYHYTTRTSPCSVLPPRFVQSSIFVQLSSCFFSNRFIRVQVVQLYSCTDMTTAWKNSRSFYQRPVFDDLFHISHTIQVRRARHERFYRSSKGELMRGVLLWTTYDHNSAGWQAKTCIHLYGHWVPSWGVIKSNDRYWRTGKESQRYLCRQFNLMLMVMMV